MGCDLKKKIISISSAIVAAIVIIAFAAPTENSIPEGNEPEIMSVTADVIMPTKVSRPGCEETDVCYIPSKIVINKGDSVTWLNEDSAFHSVTSGFYDSPTGLFDSGYLDPYQSFSFTFEKTGLYDYYCTLHPWMDGQVMVE